MIYGLTGKILRQSPTIREFVRGTQVHPTPTQIMPDPKPFTPAPLTLPDAQRFYTAVLFSFIRNGTTSEYMPVILLHNGRYYVVALKLKGEIEELEHGDTLACCSSAYFTKNDGTVGDKVPCDVFFKIGDVWWETEF